MPRRSPPTAHGYGRFVTSASRGTILVCKGRSCLPSPTIRVHKYLLLNSDATSLSSPLISTARCPNVILVPVSRLCLLPFNKDSLIARSTCNSDQSLESSTCKKYWYASTCVLFLGHLESSLQLLATTSTCKYLLGVERPSTCKYLIPGTDSDPLESSTYRLCMPCQWLVFMLFTTYYFPSSAPTTKNLTV